MLGGCWSMALEVLVLLVRVCSSDCCRQRGLVGKWDQLNVFALPHGCQLTDTDAGYTSKQINNCKYCRAFVTCNLQILVCQTPWKWLISKMICQWLLHINTVMLLFTDIILTYIMSMLGKKITSLKTHWRSNKQRCYKTHLKWSAIRQTWNVDLWCQ